MDEAQARATLALMEVVGKMMIGLADTGALPRDFCWRSMLVAAERLEPTDDGKYLKLWRTNGDNPHSSLKKDRGPTELRRINFANLCGQ